MVIAIENQIESNQKLNSHKGKLRILLDARKLYDGGIGVYTQNLIEGLLNTGEVQLSIIVKPDEELPTRWLEEVTVMEDAAKPYSYDEMLNLPKRIDFSEIDLFHVPHYTLPFKVPVRSVITIHDLIHINRPERRYYPMIAAPLVRSAMKRAATILTVSEASKSEILNLVNSNAKLASKIRVVPNAVDSFFIQKAISRKKNGQAKPKVCGRYLLSIFSNLKPHKGLKDLLLAFQQVQKSHKDIKLVLAGHGTEGIVGNGELLELTSSIKNIIILGSLSKDELADVFRNAEALVVPSLAEGFFIPVIEAQAMGTVVITRPVPATLEIVRKTDLVCKDFTVSALADKISEHIARSDRRVPGQEAAMQEELALEDHLKRFDQLSVAKTVLQIYKETLAEKF